MSGIVGILNLDGSPADQELLDSMTAFLAFRGPDAQATWVGGPVGFGHALLRTTIESEQEKQPHTLDGQVWVVADARIDDRANLIRKLVAHADKNLDNAPDVELILRAYHSWGEACVEHLLGDFAFAIWDRRRHRLFCARDHFGIRPFCYAVGRNCLVFSNTLNCVRLHPTVSRKLHDLAIADFLLFECNQDVSTSAFRDIRRLPPAHTLTCSHGRLQLRRYWSLPPNGEIRHRRQQDYPDHFNELFRQAIKDRLRGHPVGVLMSGGMDSSSVAAVARSLVGDKPHLAAFTVVYDSLIPDEERYYSELVSQAVRIPIHYLHANDYELYERWDQPELCPPEPYHAPSSLTLDHDLHERVAAVARVALTGLGADPAMLGSSGYAFAMLKSGAWVRLAADITHSLARGQLPKLGIRSHFRRWMAGVCPQPALPGWFNPDLVARLDLANRWQEVNRQQRPEHPRRPEGWLDLTNSGWPYTFECCDAGFTRFPLEHRHAFFDLRLMTYLLSIPALPWCDNKEVLRSAMVGLLPERVRRRPKTPLAGDPVQVLLDRGKFSGIDRVRAACEIDEYVVRDRVPFLGRGRTGERSSVNLRPLSLNYWLHGRNQVFGWPGVSLRKQAIRRAIWNSAASPSV
jgi:asparagine synthase (glutamine-hydrolysing)